jgi:uncharacterized protein YggE
MHAFVRPVLALALLASPVLSLPALAQDMPRQITVTGEGSISAAPDLAWVNVGVSERAATAAEAVAQMSAGMAAVMAQLAAAGVAPADIQTGQLSLYPNYDDRSYESAPEVSGYTASIAVDVRVRDLDRVGTILDAVVADGANTFGGIRFDLADSSTAFADARRDAVADGRAKAELYADAAGVTLGNLVTLSENTFFATPVMAAPRIEAADSVPIAAGEVSFAASVVMVYDITD